ncbi:hypothetical protein [Parasphingopyxis sp.]|uniref:hypothetical protein n=1 Tax=Parasphingopyxis sp. TaxID=1920299 RepID=UPI00260E0DE8|nr:hypothetical protein [Parasphingopyxis sp.]
MFTVKSIKPDGSEYICGPFQSVGRTPDHREVNCFGDGPGAVHTFSERETDEQLDEGLARQSTRIYVMNERGATVAQYNI